jgi:ABC-type multidrug transport system fused ATPase/permease subunit
VTAVKQFFRGLYVQMGLAFRADPWRATFVLVGFSVGPMTFALSPLFMKHLVDGFLAGDSSAVTRAAVSFGLISAGGSMIMMFAFNQMVPLMERTGRITTERLLNVTASIHGLEHFERPEYADNVEVIQTHRSELAGGIHVLTGALGVILQVCLTGALLSQINPLLLLLPVFALPSLATGALGEKIRQRYLDTSADRVRQARHLFELGTQPGPGKELRVFGLRRFLVERPRGSR